MITELRKPGTDEYFITLEHENRKATFRIWKGYFTGEVRVSMTWGKGEFRRAIVTPSYVPEFVRWLAKHPEWRGSTGWDDLAKSVAAKVAALA